MNKEKLQARTKRVLAEMARKQGIANWRGMSKDDLVSALRTKLGRVAANKSSVGSKRPTRLRTQAAAARDTSQGASAEEQVERSKYEVGVTAKDLSAKVPKDLPGGYGRDRIVVMVRDPYWLHSYW